MIWRLYLASWERAPDGVNYCRRCRHEAGSGHPLWCPTRWIEHLIPNRHRRRGQIHFKAVNGFEDWGPPE